MNPCVNVELRVPNSIPFDLIVQKYSIMNHTWRWIDGMTTRSRWFDHDYTHSVRVFYHDKNHRSQMKEKWKGKTKDENLTLLFFVVEKWDFNEKKYTFQLRLDPTFDSHHNDGVAFIYKYIRVITQKPRNISHLRARNVLSDPEVINALLFCKSHYILTIIGYSEDIIFIYQTFYVICTRNNGINILVQLYIYTYILWQIHVRFKIVYSLLLLNFNDRALQRGAIEG